MLYCWVITGIVTTAYLLIVKTDTDNDMGGGGGGGALNIAVVCFASPHWGVLFVVFSKKITASRFVHSLSSIIRQEEAIHQLHVMT